MENVLGKIFFVQYHAYTVLLNAVNAAQAGYSTVLATILRIGTVYTDCPSTGGWVVACIYKYYTFTGTILNRHYTQQALYKPRRSKESLQVTEDPPPTSRAEKARRDPTVHNPHTVQIHTSYTEYSTSTISTLQMCAIANDSLWPRHVPSGCCGLPDISHISPAQPQDLGLNKRRCWDAMPVCGEAACYLSEVGQYGQYGQDLTVLPGFGSIASIDNIDSIDRI
jgi:hypothetical protein